MRSVLCTLLVALLSLTALSCNSQSTGSSQDGRTTITFWHSFVQSTIPALEELVKRFEEEHPHIRLNAQYVPTGDALVQKLITAVQSNSAPDVSWIRSHYLEDLVRAEAIFPISELTGLEAGLPAEDLEDIYPALLQYSKWRGTLYSVPMEATNLGLLYNKDHFREVGLDPERPPRTWDELREYSRRLTRLNARGDRPERIGFMVPAVPADGPQGAYMMWQWLPFIWQAGGYIITEDQTRVVFDEEPGVRALGLWRDIFQEQRQVHFGHEAITAFASRQASMILDGPWNLPRYPRLLRNIDWGIAMLPAGPEKAATVVSGEFLAVFRQSRNPDAAWAFLEWMIRPEIQAFWSMESGYLPVRASALDVPEFQAFLADHPEHRAFVEQMEYAQAQRSIDFHTVAIQRNIAIALERATVGNQDPATALREMAAASNSLLDSVPREDLAQAP
jgi:ABC-type glycerol-3-phosphate transport system substrate-binding protein